MTAPGSLGMQVRALLTTAAHGTAGTSAHDAVLEVAARFEEPLRVAVAGRVKAGKSTLLNALVGEQLAPTDAGECTLIPTWYRHGLVYRVHADVADGGRRMVRFHRDGGAVEVELGDLDAADVRRLVVEWPSSALTGLTLIDTPGFGALSGAGERTASVLLRSDAADPVADAVVYLLRHVHGDDVRFLEAFQDETGRPTPVGTVGVLSRIDEIGGGRLDGLASAERIAERYRDDAKLRRLCPTIVPVAGLLAEAAAVLTEREGRALAHLASLPHDEAQVLLVSADLFAEGRSSLPLAEVERRHLLDRLGIFGLRLCHALLVSGTCTSTAQLVAELRRRSGIDRLRAVLTEDIAGRAEVLKSRSALSALERIVVGFRGAGPEQLLADIERVRSGAHELAELRLLAAVRSGAVAITDGERAEAERLLARNRTVADRLGLPADADADEARRALLAVVERWRRRAEHPLATPPVVEAAGVVVRSCEGMVVALT